MEPESPKPKTPRRKLTMKDHIEKLLRMKQRHVAAAAKCDQRIAALKDAALAKVEALKAEAGITG